MKDSFILSDDDSSEFPTMPTMRGGDPSTLGRIDHYDVLRKLGGGGFGVVYLARDSASGLEVALKTLHPLLKNNPEEMDNLREKFALASRLSHPNIATALVLHPCRDLHIWNEEARRELKLSAGDSVMVMRYAPGVTLSRWRRQFDGGAAPPGQAIEIVRQIASALDYAHGEKIVHRDVKPGNIMVETRGDGTVRARLLDFGLAAEIRSSMSRISSESGDTSGTRPYMAPEQWQGRPQDGRTDQYALACVLFELLSGEPPLAGVFETGDPMVMRASVLSESPSPVSGIPAAANAALARALSKRPSERFPSCTAFVDAMERAVTAFLSPGEASHPGELQGEGGFQTAVNDQTIKRSNDDPPDGASVADLRAARVTNVHDEAQAVHRRADAIRQEPAAASRTPGRVTDNGHEGVQLWEGGPYWATTNIGAERPEDYGLYFWWGDTVGYRRSGYAFFARWIASFARWVASFARWVASDGSSRNFAFSMDNTPTFDKSISELKRSGWLTSEGVLAPEHDAAHAHWGGAWRMPTDAELEKLSGNCEWTWTTQNGYPGYLVRGRWSYSTASIFLPAAGHGYGPSLYIAGSYGSYWSSVPDGSDSNYACYLDFDSGDHGTSSSYRYLGQSVRPVQGFAN